MTTNIGQIINYLQNISEITDIVGNRIYWGIPNTEPTQTYITIMLITERQPLSVELINRIEFRIIAGDTTTSFATLTDLDNKLLTALRNYNQDSVYKVVINNLVQLYDEKNRKILLRDYNFYKWI